jgi:hypothetical protein
MMASLAPETWPHVVILGAGASRAAFPNGERNGRRVPLMEDLVNTVGLGPILADAGVQHDGANFEELYGRLTLDARYDDCRKRLETRLVDYFAGMELPDEPTLYDHLLLSLQSKDVIATFNWDPFLMQATVRCRRIAPTPHLAILHGCAVVGYCDCEAPILFRLIGDPCERCDEPFKPTPLLYPVGQKDYASDPLIAAAWKDLRMALERAYLLTIFGYGAPTTDAEAISLMSEAWGDPGGRRMEETEIIDVKPKQQLAATWGPFIHGSHWGRYLDFYDTFAARHPRRSCAALFNASQMNNPDKVRRLPQGASWSELEQFLRPLIEEEREERCEAGGHTVRPRGTARLGLEERPRGET